MPVFHVAEINEDGRDAVVVFVGRPVTDQESLALQVCATSAGFAGAVVPAWKDDGGGFACRAPISWQPFFSQIDWTDVVSRACNKLACGK